MIEVKNNRIYFYNTNKRDIIPVDFQCVSTYLCPHCKKVLAAYYAGNILDLEPFMEDPALKHHYTLGTSNSGQYLLLDDHNHKKGCPGWEIVSLHARSITHSVDVWARRYEVGPENLQKLCEMIAASKIPGFNIVQDACGADEPIVLYNEHLFTNMNKPGFGQSITRKENLAAYVDWIVAGDYSKPFEPPIKPKTEPLIDAPKDDLPSLVDIETETGDQSTKSVFEYVIDVYTRAEAFDDGVLVDVTETAKEAGIVYRTAVTQALLNGYIEPLELQRLPGHAGKIMGCTYNVLFQLQGNEKVKYRHSRIAEGYCTDTLFQDYFPDAFENGEAKDGNCGSQSGLRPGR